MKSIKSIATISIMASIISVGMYVLINHQTESLAAAEFTGAAQTAPDRQLCERLIRFGQVAFDREQFAEAKHFFQKAIMVDPSHVLAWKKYNHAFLALISAKVETDPGFLPEFSPYSDATDSTRQMSSDTTDDDGC